MLQGVAASQRSICTDTCPHARDGKCQDGRQTADSPKYGAAHVLCDLGTDCSDCGPWVTDAPDAMLKWKPIEELTAAGMPVYAKRLEGPPTFYFAVTEPQLDVDQSAAVLFGDGIEVTVNRVWDDVLRGCKGQGVALSGVGSANTSDAKTASGRTTSSSMPSTDTATPTQPPLVVDVGGHFGYYSLLAAAHGCRAVAWEPVPRFAAFFKYNILLNGFASLVELREAVVGDAEGVQATISYPAGGALGLAGIGGLNLDDAAKRAGILNVTRVTERVDKVIDESAGDILMMKVDVEGYEAPVLAGAKGLFTTGKRVKNLVFEYSPGVWERHSKWSESGRLAGTLVSLLNAGYTALEVPFGGERGETKPLRAVTKDMLVHDIGDMARMQVGRLGCPTPAALNAVSMRWCNAWPLGTHPQSFHSVFLHNTNVWLARERTPGAWEPNGTASVFDVGLPQKQLPYFVPLGGTGTNGVYCNAVEPQYQPRYRCPCLRKEACGALEAAFLNATDQLTPPADDDIDVSSFKISNW